MNHIALLGDSVFDNASYVQEGDCVQSHLKRILTEEAVTLLATDGAVISSVSDQIEQLPTDVTHLVLSVGGNNLLQVGATLLATEAPSVGHALAHCNEVVEQFTIQYVDLARTLASLGKSLTICTIYDSIPNLPTPERQGIALFNDIITRTVFSLGANLIDLRVLCDDSRDFSPHSPIEPSEIGGLKIAHAIANMARDTGTGLGSAKVYR